jgi:hypothetical protein
LKHGYTKVFFHGQKIEKPPILRDKAYAQAGDVKRLHVVNGSILKKDPALRRREKPHDGSQGGRFSSPVSSEENGHLAGVDLEGYALQDVVFPDMGVYPFNLKERLSHESFLHRNTLSEPPDSC